MWKFVTVSQEIRFPLICRSVLVSASTCFICMGGCLGCYERPTFNPSVNESSKGLRVQGEAGKKASISEGFWTTSTCDMDNSAVQSQGSLLLWNQIRQRWVGNRKSGNRKREVQEPKLNWNATYESLLGSNKPFPQPIPLSEMIDFLVDVWEQDGLYD
ncbi:hypothetical protein V6N12_029910 [Hibiscus sabdariffa]|uniref:Gag1-like clamp domain-containing protein n=1 Tax=Hibiscus sabdariffa TaxID=183260 RepID=A0ABR2CXI3_9ROSI